MSEEEGESSSNDDAPSHPTDELGDRFCASGRDVTQHMVRSLGLYDEAEAPAEEGPLSLGGFVDRQITRWCAASTGTGPPKMG